MTFKELKKKIKEEQKSLAQKIKNGKSGRKPGNRDDSNMKDFNNLDWNRHGYRHSHIAYCQFFNNTPYSMIEEPRDDNSPSSNRLETIQKGWESQLDEALRDCA